MFCTKCGNEIDEKAVMCPHCKTMLAPIMAPVIPNHEKESYIMNATSGSLMVWMLFQIIIAFSITFIFGIGYAMNNFSYYGSSLEYEFTNSLTTVVNVTTLLATVGSTLFTILIFKPLLKIKMPDLKKVNMSFPRILYYAAIAIGLSAAASYGVSFINYVLSFLNIQMTTPDFSMSFDPFNNIVLLLTTCIAAPIFEELLFRGLILSSLKRFGNMFAIIITSILFGLAHGNVPQTIPTILISLVLCYVTLRSKSLVPAIMIHFINNVLSMAFTYLLQTDMAFVPYISIALDFILIAFAIAILIWKRKNIMQYIQKHKGKPVHAYFTHWAPIVYSILSVLLIITTFSLLFRY